MKKHEENVVDLRHEDSVKKIQEIVDNNSICLFTTNLSSVPLDTRPMTALQVDDEGNLWFLSARDSEKNEDILNDPRVQLFFSNEKKAEFLSLYGQASVAYNREKIDELWTPIAKAWFKEGKEDPHLTCIKVSPEEAFYWDTRQNRLITVFKLLASAASGKNPDVGVKGRLHV